jgi:hypothetical protein
MKDETNHRNETSRRASESRRPWECVLDGKERWYARPEGGPGSSGGVCRGFDPSSEGRSLFATDNSCEGRKVNARCVPIGKNDSTLPDDSSVIILAFCFTTFAIIGGYAGIAEPGEMRDSPSECRPSCLAIGKQNAM